MSLLRTQKEITRMAMHLVEIVQKVKFANLFLFRPEVHFK